MELSLLDNTGNFKAKLFTHRQTILKAKVRIKEGHTSLIRGNAACEEYRKKLFHGEAGRNFCIHIKRNPNCPDNRKKCIARVHGCLWEDLDSLWLEGLRIRLIMGFCISNEINGMSSYPPVLCAEIPISRSKYTSPFPIDPVNEACMVGRNFAELEDVPFHYFTLMDPKFGSTSRLHVIEVITLIADRVPEQRESLSREGGGEITLFADTEGRAAIRINRKILDSEIHSDVAIAGKDGREFNCNKTFLAAHSSVFAEMLETDMKEAKKTNRIEVQMTQNGVKALLDYMYTFDVDQAYENGEIALELLQAGHKYEIRSLEKKISSILVDRNVEFFTMDVALDLFLFARKVGSMKDIKSKAAAVLMAKPKEFLDSASFKKIRKENRAEYSDALEELFFLSSSK